MTATTPPSLSSLPTAPSTADAANFDTRADAFVAALSTMQIEQAALALNLYNNALEAQAQAIAAAAQASNSAGSAAAAANQVSLAAAVAGVTKWISGATYAQGDCVWSTAKLLTYRRAIAGAGTTDPAFDSTNWTLLLSADGASGPLFLATNFGAF